MPTYIGLAKFTDQGIKDIKNAPQGMEDGIKGLEAAGGKVIGAYLVMGEYDLVGIMELPNDEAAMTWAVAMSATGNIRTTTLKAFTREEFEAIIKRLP